MIKGGFKRPPLFTYLCSSHYPFFILSKNLSILYPVNDYVDFSSSLINKFLSKIIDVLKLASPD